MAASRSAATRPAGPAHRRTAPLAALAACCALWASAPAFAGPAALDRLAVRDGRAGSAGAAADGPEPSGVRAERDSARAGCNETQHPTEALRRGHGEKKPVALNPRWATCFVQSEAKGRSVLEEWQMQGVRENVEAFQSWREGTSTGQVDVHCVKATQPADDVVCLECLTATVAYSSGSVATLGAPIAATFVGAQQCVAGAPGGTAFCKSGQVVA